MVLGTKNYGIAPKEGWKLTLKKFDQKEGRKKTQEKVERSGDWRTKKYETEEKTSSM